MIILKTFLVTLEPTVILWWVGKKTTTKVQRMIIYRKKDTFPSFKHLSIVPLYWADQTEWPSFVLLFMTHNPCFGRNIRNYWKIISICGDESLKVLVEWQYRVDHKYFLKRDHCHNLDVQVERQQHIFKCIRYSKTTIKALQAL